MPEGSADFVAAKNNVSRPGAQRSKPERVKPAKPYPDFPLFPHATRRWAKKIRGRFVFFGPWEDPTGALERYLGQKDALLAGLVPREAPTSAPRRVASAAGGTEPVRAPAGARANVAQSAGIALRDLVNHFLTAKQRKVETGELSRRSFADYHVLAKRLIDFFNAHRLATDFQPDDWGRFRQHLATTRGPLALGADITKVRGVFKFGYEQGLLEVPMRFGPQFDKPSRKSIRVARSKRAERMFEAPEIKSLLEGASVQMKAMILLGVNCGMGNTDIASLPRSALHLGKAMLEFPRPKTGVSRRAPLWPETVAALKAVAKIRPDPKADEDADLVFVTKYGARWVRVQDPKGKRASVRAAVTIDGVSLEFGKLMRATETHVPGRGFYALRHSFRTVADEVRDRPAVDLIMGHENGRDVATHYVERISDERLKAVTGHVRGWLFPSK